MNEQTAVIAERSGRVLVVTLNRPEQRNAVNLAVAKGIATALDELDADTELSVGVLTGAGRGFCAGMDLKALVAAAGALLRLPRALPHGVAMELALTGDPITAERGYELGLVNRLTEPGAALEQALELAATIAANGPLALAATKRILTEGPGWSEAEFWRLQGEITGPVFGSEDAREGATAFAEKRPPAWKGR